MSEGKIKKEVKKKEEVKATASTNDFFLAFDGLRKNSQQAVIAPYKFGLAKQLNALEFDFLQQVYADWLPSFRTHITLALKSDLQIQQNNLVIKTYADFLEGLEDSAAIVVYGKLQAGQMGFLVFQSKLALILVRKLLGGVRKEATESRLLTLIEKNLLKQFANDCLLQWSKNFSKEHLINTTFEILTIESGTRFIPKPKKTFSYYFVQELTWEVDGEQGQCFWATPCEILDPILTNFREKRNQFDPQKQQSKNFVWRDTYADITLPLTAEWRSTFKISDILTWAPETVLDFPISSVENTLLKVNGAPKFFTELGIENNCRVVKIKGKTNECE